MVEVPASALTGSLRVGVQIISSQKRPVIEVYHQVCNRFGPEIEFDMSIGSTETKTVKSKTRFQDIFVQFTLVNIGSIRAENLSLTVEGDLKNDRRNIFRGLFKNTIEQFAPGQTQFLFLLQNTDLMQYPPEGGMPLGLKKQKLTITASYDAPPGILNWLLSIPSKLRKKKRFTTTYTFFPQLIEGDLPPAEYA